MTDLEKFQAILPSLIRTLEEVLTLRRTPKAHVDHLLQCLDANLNGGKLNRGLTVVDTGHQLAQQPLSNEEFTQLGILSWLTEILHAAYLIWDDIIDGSGYRRGQPYWHRQEGVHMKSIPNILALSA
ncbi:hypothetical protein N7530_009387 [Penicillium desertorum]|uniref:Farnesyl diphosphate synthase n=1 Tax=Penicillium desertorum TaxID=1303715 RepID=A0A9W9WIJ7_9EURO|nr:hypothetical protein N7530_009387 [Penicillium desertorum]